MGTMRFGNELETSHEPAAEDDFAKEKAASYSNEFRICRRTPYRERAPFAGMECAGKPDVERFRCSWSQCARNIVWVLPLNTHWSETRFSSKSEPAFKRGVRRAEKAD